MGCLFIWVELLRSVLGWLIAMISVLLQVVRWLGQQILRFIVPAIEELGSRGLVLGVGKRGAWKWVWRGFTSAGPEEGIAASFELAGIVELVTGLIAVTFIAGLIAIPILIYLNNARLDREQQSYLLEINRELLNRGGFVHGMPPDLGRNWIPGPGEQEALKKLLDLSVSPSTSAGPGDADDQGQINDLQKLNALRADHAAPTGGAARDLRRASPNLSSNPGPSSSVKPSPMSNGPGTVRGASDVLNEGDLQAKRLAAIARGDIGEYNRLIEEHKALYKKHGIDPCASGFFPQGCSQ